MAEIKVNHHVQYGTPSGQAVWLKEAWDALSEERRQQVRAMIGTPNCPEEKKPIDHDTCGHVNHTTLDGSRHEEIHTAVFELIQKWSLAGNCEGSTAAGRVYREVVADLVDAMHPFEIEQ